MSVYADPKEHKRRKERERYANNKDDISKRRRHLRELKKESMAVVNDGNIPCDTQTTGNSGVTQGHVL